MVVGTSQRSLRGVLTYGTLILFAAYSLFPFLWMIDTALKPVEEVRSADPSFWIDAPTLSNGAPQAGA